jgi:hypothetical protein
MIELAVPSLQTQASVHRLEISDPRLCFYPDHKPEAGDRRIPRTTVARHRQGHLRSPSEVAMDSRVEAPQQHDVCGVSDRVASRKQAQRCLETDCRSDLADGGEWYLTPQTALQSPDLRAGHACSRADVPHAQPCTDSCEPDLAPRGCQLLGTSSLCSLLRSLPRSHVVERRTGPFTGGYFECSLADVAPRVTPGGSTSSSGNVVRRPSHTACRSADDEPAIRHPSRRASLSANIAGSTARCHAE